MNVELPDDVWRRVVYWLSPLDRLRFKFVTRHAAGILTSSQAKHTAIWATIFRMDSAAHKAQKLGLDLALLGRIDDIGKKDAEKPELILLTLPRGPEMQPILRSEMGWDARNGAYLYDCPEFTLNTSGVYNRGKDILLRRERLSKLTDEDTSILYYSRDRPLKVEIIRHEYQTGYYYWQIIYIGLEGGDIVSLTTLQCFD